MKPQCRRGLHVIWRIEIGRKGILRRGKDAGLQRLPDESAGSRLSQCRLLTDRKIDQTEIVKNAAAEMAMGGHAEQGIVAMTTRKFGEGRSPVRTDRVEFDRS